MVITKNQTVNGQQDQNNKETKDHQRFLKKHIQKIEKEIVLEDGNTHFDALKWLL